MQEWLNMSAADLGRGLGTGEIDAVALTQTYLDAIEAHPHRDLVYSVVTRDRAMAEAKAAQTRAQHGQRLGLLDGVPISWKDLFDSAGDETKSGSDLLSGRVPDHDCEVLRNATSAGLVCLGKTHMSELAFSGLGLNPVTATPPCVNDADAVPGGSSSGAAASVAFSLAACGIGSDTGGSVRIPSAWNDLVGLKTTSGRITLNGVLPLAARFDTVGPLCRTVEDAAVMMTALEGGNAIDLKGASLDGLRIATLQTVVLDDVRDAPLAGFRSAVERLQAAGAIVEKLDAPEVADAMPLSPILFASEAYGTWSRVIEADPDKMYPRILERFRGGADFAASDYVSAWHMLDALRQEWAARVAGYDAVIMPTAPTLPPSMERLLTDDDYYTTENLLALRNTRVANLFGLSAISLPTGVPSCGIMLCGPAFGEEKLLRVAKAAEEALS